MADGTTDSASATVVRLKPKAAASASDRKWTKPVMATGFCIVPSLLLRAQQRLGLNPTQLAVLLHLTDYWWEADRKPFPSKKTLGDRLGLGPRQVQRYLAELEEAGFLTRNERRASHGGIISNEYDLSGLVDKLKSLAPEFRAVEEETRSRRRSVTRPRRKFETTA